MADRKIQKKPEGSVKQGRVFRAELPDKISLEAGEEYTGVFQRAGLIEITDKLTHEKKQVMQYLFRNPETGRKEAILGAFQLDMTFEDLFESLGGQEKVQGMTVKISRGDDSKLAGAKSMGNYEISLLD